MTHSVTEKSQAVGSPIFERTPQLTKKLKVCLECGVWQRAVVVGFRSACSSVFTQREREREGLGVASSVFSLDFIVERRFSLGGPLDLPIDKPQKPSQ